MKKLRKFKDYEDLETTKREVNSKKKKVRLTPNKKSKKFNLYDDEESHDYDYHRINKT